MACWSHGVPVVYLAELGKGVAKMDGMVVYTNSRPVIILSKVSSLWAWQLFILAHEVAHVALGHVAPDEILVDEKLSEDSYASKDIDLDERAADMFALELLNGKPNATYTSSDNQVNFRELAESAFQFGKAHHIDPGHIVLNFANQSGNWKVGYAAAKVLQGENPPAPMVINSAMWGGIDSEVLPPDTVEFLSRVTDSHSTGSHSK
ncbi:ImmA/IrrE family metallo-endopeptidase [Scytonema hofmannii]|nr:ImmA/IrrE family metallo-endopeptidase [Scytonema hofmannii]